MKQASAQHGKLGGGGQAPVAPLRLRRAAVANDLPAPRQFAQATGLLWVNDQSPGIRRVGSARRFRYVAATGRQVRDAATLGRIKSLVIPPAWREVWICPSPRGHIQATGIDARGRKQYRYHPDWRKTRDETKFDRMIAFGQALPTIRAITERHLKLKGLPREKVLAAVTQLLEKTLIRVGNSEYAKSNKSFGLTTIRNHHARIRGGRVTFEFKGKSGVAHAIDLEDGELARVVSKCQELPGQELFGYEDEAGGACDVTSADVNAYLKEITGQEFTAKDFRTWAGTVLAARALRAFEPFMDQTESRKNVVAAVERVAKALGNTKAVCRKCYIHPAVVHAYLDGSLVKSLQQRARAVLRSGKGLKGEEAALLAYLQERLKREAG